MIISRASASFLLLMAPAVAVAADIPGGPGTSATLAVGAQATSDLHSTTDADWFRVSVQAGKLYAFTVSTSAAGDDLGFRLSATDAAGRVAAAADLFTRGDWETKQINFRPKTAGVHYLEVRLTQPRPPLSGLTLDYLVGLFRDVSSSFDDAARLPFGREVTGSLESGDDIDYYVVRLEQGKPVDLLVPFINHEDTVNLHDRDRKFLDLVDANWGKLAYHVPTYTGDHFVRVSRRFGGSYTLKVAPADRGRATWGDDLIIGTDGPDVINAYSGNDQVRGLAGNDVLRGGPGENTILGGGGNDRLEGGPTFDYLFGDGGNDVLVGGSWVDDLNGGAGSDRFVFTGDAVRGYDSGSLSNPEPSNQSPDRINDFAAGDKIDLRGVDADATRAGRQALAFIGTAAFSGPGQLRYRFFTEDASPRTMVALNTDADPAPEMEIKLGQRFALRAVDFTLRDPPRPR